MDPNFVLPFGQELDAFVSQQPQQLRLRLVPRNLATILDHMKQNIGNTFSFSLDVTSFAASSRSLSRSNPVISHLTKKPSLFTTLHRSFTQSCHKQSLMGLQEKKRCHKVQRRAKCLKMNQFGLGTNEGRGVSQFFLPTHKLLSFFKRNDILLLRFICWFIVELRYLQSIDSKM